MARNKNQRQKVFEQSLANVSLVIYKHKNGTFSFSLKNNATDEVVQGRPQTAPEAASFMATMRLSSLQW